jgi:crotonobetainyl-CoA:carnitine CoA-transferase CaiB-like acyl-CoA transferase
VPALRPPAILRGADGDVDDRFDPVPALGEHTAAILAEFGLT